MSQLGLWCSMGTIATAIISNFYLDLATSPHDEIITECLCWCAILLSITVYFYFSSTVLRVIQTSRLNVITLGAAMVCMCSSRDHSNWITAPFLTLIPIIIKTAKATEALLPENSSYSMVYHLKKRQFLFTAIFAIIVGLNLWQGSPPQSSRLNLCWLIAQTAVYMGLYLRVSDWDKTTSTTSEEVLYTARELALCMIIVTGPLSMIWWRDVSTISQISMIVAFKISRWTSVLALAFQSQLPTIPWIYTFCVCTQAVWTYSYGLRSGLIFFAALAMLGQIARSIPYPSRLRWTIMIFCILPLYLFMNQHSASFASSSTYILSGSTPYHPVDALMQKARSHHDTIQARQSHSLIDAIVEYRRRYGRPPPPGFDKWYKFAIENDVPLIDEYDTLTKSFEPYWQISPKVLRDSLQQALLLNSSYLAVLEIENHVANVRDGYFQHAQMVSLLLQPILKLLPNMKAILNNLDEPRVVIPHDILHRSSKKALSGALPAQEVVAAPVSFASLDHQKTWDSIILSCPPDSPARSPAIPKTDSSTEIRFISNTDEARNICLWSSDKANQHGFLSSASALEITHQFIPIMSTAKVSTFQDMLIPSSYYFQDDIAEYDDEWDIPWDQKEDVVYWRGSGTGGYWSGGSWRNGHRQRLVEFVNSAEQTIHLLNETRQGHWKSYDSTIGRLKGLFKIKFSKFLQCDESDCDAQESHFHKVAQDTTHDSYKYKVLFNLDGNSFSGRYYRFLKSNSLVFMQNLFREWHEDRLFPWVHYVPVSNSMDELPELSRYLLHDARGKVLAGWMAKESRDWARRSLRPIDLSAALFRALLEYDWLFNDDRDEWSCCT